MASLFDDEVLSIALKFSFDKRAMEDAGRALSKMSLELDNAVRKAASAGKPLSDIFTVLQRLDPALKKIEDRARSIGGSAQMVGSLRKNLEGYTKNEDRVNKMAEVQAARVAETSGTASLRKSLDRVAQAIERSIATNRGIYDRRSGKSGTAQVTFLDTETTGLNPNRHGITELTAIRAEVDKKTGEIKKILETVSESQAPERFRQWKFKTDAQIAALPAAVARKFLDQAERVTGDQLKKLSQYLPNQVINSGQSGYVRRGDLLPSGVTLDSLRGKQIPYSRVRSMLQRSDYVVAHNAPFDRAMLEKKVPEAAGIPWMDSVRGIGWRERGFPSRALQDIARVLGVNPGRAHRSFADVPTMMQVLNTVPPGGGQRLMAELIGNQGPMSASQQQVAVIGQIAKEIQQSLMERLGVGRRFDPLSVRYAPNTMKNFASTAPDGVVEVFSQYLISEIEGGITARSRRPTRSTDYGIKRGSGYSQETTPGQLGESAISLDRRKGTVDEFIRNLAISAGPASSSQILQLYEDNAKHQENIQQSRGRGRQTKDEIRSGEELALATMRGVNTQLFNYREGNNLFVDNPLSMSMAETIANSNIDALRNAVSQVWAKTERKFQEGEIEEFIKTKGAGMAPMDRAITAAQIARQVGLRSGLTVPPSGGHPGHRVEYLNSDPRLLTLSSILERAQYEGRYSSATREAERRRQMFNRMGSGGVAGSRFSGVISKIFGSVSDVGGAINAGLNEAAKGNDVSAFGAGAFNRMFEEFRKRRSARASASSTSTAADAAMNGPTSADIRASMRADALRIKLEKLAEAVGDTETAFRKYNEVTAPARRHVAQQRYESRLDDLMYGQIGRNISFDAQERTAKVRLSRAQRSGPAKESAIMASFERKLSDLGFEQIYAEMAHEDAIRKANQVAKKMQKATRGDGKKRYSDQDIQSAKDEILRPAEFRLIKAQYAAQSAQLIDPTEISALRQSTAQRLAALRYPGSGDARRQSFVNEVVGTFAGPTLAQSVQSRRNSAVLASKENVELAQQHLDDVILKRGLNDAKANKQQAAAASKLGETLKKIDDDVTKKAEQNQKKKQDATKKTHDIMTRYAKDEAARGGGGGGIGGRRRTPGGGGGGGDDVHLGVGFASLVAYAGVMKELIKDTAVYAARTETLQLVTDQMAKVNGLNVRAVKAEVEAVKELNITTQEANSTVQKMMFAQLDVAKATDLARTAQDTAILANVNSSEALDKIILGIVTGQTRVLHNMNLQVSMLQVLRELRTEKRARGEGGEPTELEKRQAMLNKVLLEGAKVAGTYERSMLTVGKQFNSLQREVQEAQNAIGKEFLPEFGRFVSLATTGLHIVQENGQAFAYLASAVASLGAGLATMQGLSILKTIFTSRTPPWMKLVGTGVTLASMALLNQDTADANTAVATEQIGNIDKKIAAAKKLRERLLWDPNATTASLEIVNARIKSLYEQRLSSEEWLTQQLAAELNKRREVEENYWGRFKRDTLNNLPMFGPAGKLISRSLSLNSETSEDVLDLAPHLRDKIEAEAKRQKKESLEGANESEILNQNKINAQRIIAQMQEAEARVEEAEQRGSEVGTIGLRARKSMGSPREKILLEYDTKIAQIKQYGRDLKDLLENSKTDPSKKADLEEIFSNLGGEEKARERIARFLANQQDAVDVYEQDKNIELGKLNRATESQILGIRAQTDLEKIRAQVVAGNYASERAVIDQLYSRKNKLIEDQFKRLGDLDEKQKAVAQNEEERAQAILALEKRIADARKARSIEVRTSEAAFNASRILASPGNSIIAGGEEKLPLSAMFDNSKQAIIDAYVEEAKGLMAIEDEQERLNKQLQLSVKLRDDIVNLADAERVALVEARLTESESNRELQMEVDRIVSGKGKGSDQRALDEIERTRKSQIDAANERFNEMKKVVPQNQIPALAAERDSSVIQAKNSASKAKIVELDRQRESAQERLAQVYDKQFQREERINELKATSIAEEASAAYNTHKRRLEFIEKEYEARGKTLDALKTKEEQIREAEFDHLQKLLELRKKGIDDVRNAAGQVFDAITTRGGAGINELIAGQMKVTARTIFQNLSVEYMRDSRRAMGQIFKGQERINDKGEKETTLLGRILSGTPFSAVPDDAEIAELERKVREKGIQSEQELKASVDALNETIRNATGQEQTVTGNPRKTGSTSTTPATKSSSPYDLVPLLGGQDKNNPFIFHYGSTGATSGVTAVYSNTAAEKDNTRALERLTNALNSQKGGGGNNFLSMASILAGATMGGGGGGSNYGGLIMQGIPGPGGAPTGGGGGGAAQKGGLFGKSTMANLVGGGLLAAGGTMEAISGFKQGGGRGVSKGIGGALTTAAGIATMIPGGQLVAPFLLAGGLVANFVSSLFGDPKEKRQKEIDRYLTTSKFIAPLALNREMTSTGNLLGYNKFGVARDTMTGAFPISVQPNDYRMTMDSVFTGTPNFVEVPGRILDSVNPPAQQINYNVSLPISAMDSKDVMSRSKDIAAALHKELKLGSDVSVSIQQAVFGAA